MMEQIYLKRRLPDAQMHRYSSIVREFLQNADEFAKKPYKHRKSV